MSSFPKSIDEAVGGKVVLSTEEYEDLLRRASYDARTGLFNAERFDDQYRRDLDGARRSIQKGADRDNLSLLIIDINNLKYVNDTYGHEVGHDLLREVADLLKLYFRRESDTKARIGGDEFGVILPQTDFESARQIAYEVRRVALHLGISISIGVANYALSVNDPVEAGRYVRSFDEISRELREKADADLYRNKEQMHRLIDHKKFYDARFKKDPVEQVAA